MALGIARRYQAVCARIVTESIEAGRTGWCLPRAPQHGSCQLPWTLAFERAVRLPRVARLRSSVRRVSAMEGTGPDCKVHCARCAGDGNVACGVPQARPWEGLGGRHLRPLSVGVTRTRTIHHRRVYKNTADATPHTRLRPRLERALHLPRAAYRALLRACAPD